jgi:hypothetical protein
MEELKNEIETTDAPKLDNNLSINITGKYYLLLCDQDKVLKVDNFSSYRTEKSHPGAVIEQDGDNKKININLSQIDESISQITIVDDYRDSNTIFITLDLIKIGDEWFDHGKKTMNIPLKDYLETIFDGILR